MCWNEWKIYYPIFAISIFWVMVDFVHNFKVNNRPKIIFTLQKWPNLHKCCAICWNEQEQEIFAQYVALDRSENGKWFFRFVVSEILYRNAEFLVNFNIFLARQQFFFNFRWRGSRLLITLDAKIYKFR